MAFGHARDSKVWYSGYDISDEIRSWSAGQQIDTADVTTINDTVKTYIIGMEGGVVSLEGLYDASGTVHDRHMEYIIQIAEAFGVIEFPLVIMPQFALIGDWFIGGNTVFRPNFDIKGTVADAVKWSANLQPDGTFGTGILHEAVGTAAAIAASDGQDHGAASAGGGLFMATMVSIPSGDGVTVILEDSADNSSWSTIATTGELEGSGLGLNVNYLIELTGTIRRYTRVSVTQLDTTAVFGPVGLIRREAA